MDGASAGSAPRDPERHRRHRARRPRVGPRRRRSPTPRRWPARTRTGTVQVVILPGPPRKGEREQQRTGRRERNPRDEDEGNVERRRPNRERRGRRREARTAGRHGPPGAARPRPSVDGGSRRARWRGVGCGRRGRIHAGRRTSRPGSPSGPTSSRARGSGAASASPLAAPWLAWRSAWLRGGLGRRLGGGLRLRRGLGRRLRGDRHVDRERRGRAPARTTHGSAAVRRAANSYVQVPAAPIVRRPA